MTTSNKLAVHQSSLITYSLTIRTHTKYGMSFLINEMPYTCLLHNIPLQVQQYRFSIAWTRIYPSGKNTSLNRAGVEHYRQLIDSLLDAGIEPLPALYHKDLPQGLQDSEGWLNKDIVQDFCNYAAECFRQYGSKV